MEHLAGNADHEPEPARDAAPLDVAEEPTFERSAIEGGPPATCAQFPLLRLIPHSRRLRLAGTLGVVALCLAILLGSSPALRAVVGGPLAPAPAATATPPLIPGEDLFYVAPDIPWALVTLDGHRLRTGVVGQSELPLRLGRGSHRLAWSATPFTPQSCVFSVPPQTSDTCPLADTGSGAATGSGIAPRVIHLRESLASLPPGQANALLAAMQQSVASFSTDVAPGEWYLGPGGVATQPLRATLSFALDASADGTTTLPCWLDGASDTRCAINGETCAALCTVSWQTHQAVPASTWLALAPALPTWSYATPGGHTLARGVTLAPGASGVADILTLFSISWDGARWHAIPLFGEDAPVVQDDAGRPIVGAACAPAQDDLQGNFFFLTQVRYVEDANPAEGCLVVATINPAIPPPPQVGPLPPGTTTATFLVRFRVLVALNGAAHAFGPLIPMADAQERDLAAQLEAQPGLVCATRSGGC